MRRVEITGREENKENKRADRSPDDHGKDELRGEVQRLKSAAGFVATDETHGGENADKKDTHLHEVSGRHFQRLIDPDGAAEEVGSADQDKVGEKETQAGEPRLPQNIAQDRGVAGPGFRADLHRALG